MRLICKDPPHISQEDMLITQLGKEAVRGGSDLGLSVNISQGRRSEI